FIRQRPCSVKLALQLAFRYRNRQKEITQITCNGVQVQCRPHRAKEPQKLLDRQKDRPFYMRYFVPIPNPVMFGADKNEQTPLFTRPRPEIVIAIPLMGGQLRIELELDDDENPPSRSRRCRYDQVRKP